MYQLLDQYFEPQFLTVLLAAIAAGATVLTLAMPLLVKDTLSARMKAVAFEREKIRLRERERLAQSSKATLRQSPKVAYVALMRMPRLRNGFFTAGALFSRRSCRAHLPNGRARGKWFFAGRLAGRQQGQLPRRGGSFPAIEGPITGG